MRAQLEPVIVGATAAVEAAAEPGASIRVPTPGSTNPVRLLVHELRTVLAVDGPIGLYRGYGLCLLGSAPANALYFSSYKWLKRVSARGEGSAGGTSFGRDAACGFSAEVIAAGLWTPLDVVKQRMQARALSR